MAITRSLDKFFFFWFHSPLASCTFSCFYHSSTHCFVYLGTSIMAASVFHFISLMIACCSSFVFDTLQLLSSQSIMRQSQLSWSGRQWLCSPTKCAVLTLCLHKTQKRPKLDNLCWSSSKFTDLYSMRCLHLFVCFLGQPFILFSYWTDHWKWG